MDIAPDDDYGEWLLDPELARLRSEWVRAFQAWDRISEQSPEVMLNDEQRIRLRRYYDAEAAYFARYKALTDDPQ